MAKKGDDGAAGTDEAGAKAAKGGRKRLVLLAAAAVVGLGAAGAGVMLSGVLDGEEAPAADEQAAHEAKPPASATTIFHPLPDLVISLNAPERRTAFVKLRLTAEIDSAADAARLDAMMPRIIDYCQLYLRELRPEDLQGSAGTLRLKDELMRRINAAVAPTEVRDVLLSELLIQ